MTEHLDGFAYYQQLYSNLTERPVLYGMVEAYEEANRHVKLQHSTQVFSKVFASQEKPTHKGFNVSYGWAFFKDSVKLMGIMSSLNF